MPPGAAVQETNRIGLGVHVDDPGNAGLSYVKELNAEVRTLIGLGRELGQIKFPRIGEARPREQAQVVANAARQETQEKVRQLSLFDQAHIRSTENQKRRAADVAGHAEAQGRRITDAFARATRSVAEQMRDMSDMAFRAFAATRPVDDPHIMEEMERRWRAAGPRTGTPAPKTQAELDAQARRAAGVGHAPPGRLAEVEREIEERRARQRPTLPVMPRQTSIEFQDIREDVAQAGARASEQFRERTVRRYIESQQRRQIREEFDFEQRATATVGQELRRREVEEERLAQEQIERRERRRRVNERIAQRDAQARERERQQQAQEMAHAREMAERTRRAEEAATRAGYRTPQQQEAFERENLRAYEARRERVRQARRQRQVEQERERREAERAEARRLNAEADARAIAERQARLASPEYQAQQAREEARQRNEYFAAERERGRAARERAAVRATGVLGPVQGPQLGMRDQARRQFEGRFRARLSEYGPTRADFLDVDATTAQLDRIGRAAVTAQTQLNSLRFRGGPAIAAEARIASGGIASVVARAEALRAELARPAGMRRTRTEIVSDLEAVRREMAQTTREAARLRLVLAQGGGPGGGPPDNIIPRGQGPFGSLDMVGRISRNILLYQAVAGGVYGLKQYIATGIQAARTTDDLTRAQEFAAQSIGRNRTEFEGLTEQLIRLGQTRQQALAAITEGARFAEASPRRAEALVQTVTDIATSRGLGLEQTDELIEQLRRRESKFYKRMFGVTVEEIYRADAGRRVDNSPDVDDLFIGENAAFRRANRTRRQKVNDLVENMTEAQKEAAVFNYILEQQGRFAGEAERRQNTLAGSLDKLSARWADNREAVGEFVLALKPVTGLINTTTTALERFGVARRHLQPTGPGGQATVQDVIRAQQTAPVDRFQAIDSILTTAGVALPLLGLFGRGRGRRDASRRVWQETYTDAMGRGVSEAAASAEALAAARSARAGISGSIRSGMARVGDLFESAIALGVGDVRASQVAAFAGRATIVAAVAGVVTELITATIREQSEATLARVEAGVGIENRAAMEAQRAREQGRARYYYEPSVLVNGQATPTSFSTQALTRAERDEMIRRGQAHRGQFREQIFSEEALQVELTDAEIANKQLKPAAQGIDEFWQRVEEMERERAQELLNRRASALARLREVRTNAFRVIGEVGQQYAPDNPYVALLADAESAAKRMQQQWGHLGEATVNYFTGLEQHRIRLGLLKQDFEALARAQELFNRAEREAAERGLSPDLTRQEQAYERLAQSMTAAATQIPQLERQRAITLGTGGPGYIFDQTRLLRQQLSGVDRVRSLGFGLDTQGQRAINRVVNESVMGLLANVPPGVIRNDPALRSTFGRAIEGQMQELRAQISDEAQRVRLLSLEETRAEHDITQAQYIREARQQDIYNRAIQQGRGTMFEGRFVGRLTPEESGQINQIGRLADQALIRITDAFSPRELSPRLFQLRNEAIRRDAERLLSEQEEARNAVREGLKISASILEEARLIRAAILSDDYGEMLIRVENDTQAQIDARDLKDISSGMSPRGGFPTRSSQPPARGITPAMRNSMQRYGKN